MEPSSDKPTVHSVSLSLEAGQFLAGWRPEPGTLFLPALSESRVGDEVAARVAISGQVTRATIFGKVALVRRVGRPSLPPGIDLVLDKGSIPAAGFLAMTARGEPVSFRERPPRFAAERAILLSRDGEEMVVQTINLSEGGCAVRWSLSMPLAGEVLDLRLGSHFFSPKARAVVCWNTQDGPLGRAVGMRTISEGRAARSWKAIITEVARSGARAA